MFFDPAKAALKPDARALLDLQAAWLVKYSGINILVAGNADVLGGGQPGAGRGLPLGQQWANAKRDCLLSNGVAAARISTINCGADRPTAMGASEQARAQNRNAINSVR